MTSSRKLDVIIRPDNGAEYTVYVEALPRDDGRWEGVLEFRPAHGPAMRTGTQTTQSRENDVYYWAAGLSLAHIEDAFRSMVAPLRVRGRGVSAAATPARPDERLAHLEAIERDVLSLFESRRVTRIRTQAIFDRGPHANADFVRAFEHLEKRRALLVRRTIDGTDWLELTVDGANALGLAAEPAGKVVREPAKPRR